MKYLLLFSAIISMVSCQEGPIKWASVKDDKGKFSVSLPKGYDHYSGEFTTAFGDVQLKSVYWTSSSLRIEDLGVKLMDCKYYEIPEPYLHLTAQKILDTCAAYFISKQYSIAEAGRLIEMENLIHQSFLCKRFTAMEDTGKDDSLFVSVKMFVVGKRLYTLLANGYKQNLKQGQIDTFMNSFQINAGAF